MTVQSSPPELVIIGIGLIGSSLARAIVNARKSNPAARYHVSLFDSDPEIRQRARSLELGDAVVDDLNRCLDTARIVVLATPVGATAHICRRIRDRLPSGCIVTDTGSVKRRATHEMRSCLPAHVPVVPAHPVAGTECSGPDAGFATLFHNRCCVLTAPSGTPCDAIDTVVALWRACGMSVDFMEPDEHDRVFAVTSHIPHLVAFSMVETATHIECSDTQSAIKYAASGFRDFTRLAASDPTIWSDVFLHNRVAVLDALTRFESDLTTLRRAIERRDSAFLKAHFSRNRTVRRQIIEAGQETDLPDFGRPTGTPRP